MSPGPVTGSVAGEQDRAAGLVSGARDVRDGVAGAGPASQGRTAPPGTHAHVTAAPATAVLPAVPPGTPPATAGLPQDITIVARASWPDMPGDTLTPIPAFVVSSFSPLVAEVADRCLHAYYGSPPAPAGRGARTAIILASRHGDVGTDAAVAQALAEGRRVPPLLFFQSNVNAVAGYVAARWGLAGPIVCTCPVGDLIADGLECAALLLADGDAGEALVIAAEHGSEAEGDSATAVLVAAQPQRSAGRRRGGYQPEVPGEPAHGAAVVSLAVQDEPGGAT
jgi:Beta-ketoacyl synthase, N-terminal domain